MQITKGLESRIARAVFTTGATAIAAMMLSIHASAGQIQVLAASREVEIVSPGAGSHFVSTMPETFLAEGSEVRTGKGGWAVLLLGSETQVELRADSEVIFPNTRRSDENQRSDSRTGENSRPGRAGLFSAGNVSGAAVTRGEPAAIPSDAIPTVVEVELRRGTLAALADGGTELRVRFANGVVAANHARFVVTTSRDDHARVIVERGAAHVAASDGKEQVVPTAGQFVELNRIATGHTMTAAQPVRGNDADAVAEMAALRFVPATSDPAAKPPPITADNSTVNRPTTTASAPSIVAAADVPLVNPPTLVVVSPPPPLASENPPASQPSIAPPSIIPSVPPVGGGAPALGSLVGVDPLQAPPNGANSQGLVVSPEHP